MVIDKVFCSWIVPVVDIVVELIISAMILTL